NSGNEYKVIYLLTKSPYKDASTSSQFNKIPKPLKQTVINKTDFPETPQNSNTIFNTDVGMKNAFDIIFDQAKSIQILQEKVMNLQTELEKVVIKLKSQNDTNSCSCAGRKSNEKPNIISTGTNTSFEQQNNIE